MFTSVELSVDEEVGVRNDFPILSVDRPSSRSCRGSTSSTPDRSLSDALASS